MIFEQRDKTVSQAEISEGRGFQAEKMASIKTLKQEHVWSVLKT